MTNKNLIIALPLLLVLSLTGCNQFSEDSAVSSSESQSRTKVHAAQEAQAKAESDAEYAKTLSDTANKEAEAKSVRAAKLEAAATSYAAKVKENYKTEPQAKITYNAEVQAAYDEYAAKRDAHNAEVAARNAGN